MGTTPNVAIPYVEPSDPLANYPTQDKAKADRLEVLLYDTGWVNLTPASGTGTFRYRCLARIVYIQANLSGITSIAAGASGLILAGGILPATYRPTATSIYGVANMGATLVGLAIVSSNDGNIQLLNSSASAVTTPRFSISYPQG
jgi:hypothetical protein